MNIWNLTKKDLAVFFKDRASLLWLFILPLVFLLIFAGLASLAYGAPSTANTADDRTPLAVVNLDKDGPVSRQLLADLNRGDSYRVELYDLKDAEQLLNKVKLSRYLVIPAGFSAALAAAKPVAITLVTHPDADGETNQTVLKVIAGVANDNSLELQILDGIRQMGAMQAANPQVQEIFTADRMIAQAESQFARSRQVPLVAVSQTVPKAVSQTNQPKFDLNQSIVPGIAVLFVFLAATTVARSIFEERKNGSLRRLLAAPLGRGELLLGKMVPIFILTLIQIAFMFAVGALILPLLGFGRLAIGNDPLAWAVTSICIALCATCLGILISSLARTEGQVSGLGNALLWVAGFLGGALVPSFMIQSIPVLNIVSRFMPQSWATSAYYDILARGKGLVDILPSAGVLLIFSAVFFFIGSRRFRFE